MCVGSDEYVVYESSDVLPGRHARDRSRKDVIEHQRRDADLCQGAAQCFLYDAVDASPDEHGTALHVDRAHGEREEHDRKDEPGSRFPNGLFGDAGSIKGR